MYGLEYALFFGIPENKTELFDGRSRWAFPFRSREEGEAHFLDWLETFRRWKQVKSATPIDKNKKFWRASVAGVNIELCPRPIDMRLPIAWEVFEAIHETYDRREFWPGQPLGLESGFDAMWERVDIRMNLRRLMKEIDRRQGKHSSRVDVAIENLACVAPDLIYYLPGRKNIMIERDYFGAAPDLVAEILNAPARALFHSERVSVYRRAGIPHLWVLEPADETLEVYELESDYELIGKYSCGESFECSLFRGRAIEVAPLFETQFKRYAEFEENDASISSDAHEAEPIPEWIIPSDFQLGLEYFFLLGHPERRWEFWEGKARSVLAFGSKTEAVVRFHHFVTEVCHWEGVSNPKVCQMAYEVEQAEVGRFQLTRRGTLVLLDIAVDGSKVRELLATHAQKEAWDWGE
jgi:hypothetical protein